MATQYTFGQVFADALSRAKDRDLKEKEIELTQGNKVEELAIQKMLAEARAQATIDQENHFKFMEKVRNAEMGAKYGQAWNPETMTLDPSKLKTEMGQEKAIDTMQNEYPILTQYYDPSDLEKSFERMTKAKSFIEKGKSFVGGNLGTAVTTAFGDEFENQLTEEDLVAAKKLISTRYDYEDPIFMNWLFETGLSTVDEKLPSIDDLTNRLDLMIYGMNENKKIMTRSQAYNQQEADNMTYINFLNAQNESPEISTKAEEATLALDRLKDIVYEQEGKFYYKGLDKNNNVIISELEDAPKEVRDVLGGPDGMMRIGSLAIDELSKGFVVKDGVAYATGQTKDYLDRLSGVDPGLRRLLWDAAARKAELISMDERYKIDHSKNTFSEDLAELGLYSKIRSFLTAQDDDPNLGDIQRDLYGAYKELQKRGWSRNKIYEWANSVESLGGQ